MLVRGTQRVIAPVVGNPSAVTTPVASPVTARSSVGAPSAIPEVKAIIASSTDPLVRNERYNAAYQKLALGLQEAVDPGATFRGVNLKVLPNWFAVGAHASPQVGRSMVAADRTIRALSMLRGEPHLHSREAVFKELQLDDGSKKVANLVASALEKIGASSADATAIATAVTLFRAADRATSMQGTLTDPRQAIAVGYRLFKLLRPPKQGLFSTAWETLKGVFGSNKDARDSKVLDGVLTMARTYKSLLADGNTAIFSDIGGSAEKYLRLRQKLGASMSSEAVLSQLALPESTEAGSREVFAYAMAHVHDKNPPVDFNRFEGNDVVRAGFAMYEAAGKTSDLKKKNELISFANNLIAWREQHDAVQGAFEGTRPGELSREKVIAAITPMVEVDLGGKKWSFDAYARAQGDTDGNPFTSPASEANWAKFEDRWPPILDSFKFAYANTPSVWKFPDARV